MIFTTTLLVLALCGPAISAEVCDLVTHRKMSIADFASGPDETEHFFFNDTSDLTREGKLTIVNRYFEIEFEEFRDVYECLGSRNEPCILKNGDGSFIGEARIDRSMNVVVQIERQISDRVLPLSRGGVADGGLTIYQITACR